MLIIQRCYGKALVGQGLFSKRIRVADENVAGGDQIVKVCQYQAQASIPHLIDASQSRILSLYYIYGCQYKKRNV